MRPFSWSPDKVWNNGCNYQSFCCGLISLCASSQKSSSLSDLQGHFCYWSQPFQNDLHFFLSPDLNHHARMDGGFNNSASNGKIGICVEKGTDWPANRNNRQFTRCEETSNCSYPNTQGSLVALHYEQLNYWIKDHHSQYRYCVLLINTTCFGPYRPYRPYIRNRMQYKGITMNNIFKEINK
jgi:hypothetical protein